MVKTGCRYCLALTASKFLPYCPGDIHDYSNDEIQSQYNAMTTPKETAVFKTYYRKDLEEYGWEHQPLEYKQHYYAAYTKLEQHGMEYMIPQEWHFLAHIDYRLLEVMWLFGIYADIKMMISDEGKLVSTDIENSIAYVLNWISVITQVIVWMYYNRHFLILSNGNVMSIPIVDFFWPCPSTCIIYEALQQGLFDRDAIMGIVKLFGLMYDIYHLKTVFVICTFSISVFFSMVSLFLNRKRIKCIFKYGFELQESFKNPN